MKNTKINKRIIKSLGLKFNVESISHIKPRTISFYNFFEHTFARFVKIEASINHEPDYISASGSQYWHMGDYVIRYSNRWGRERNCYWYLSSGSEYLKLFQTAYAMCKYSDFIDLVYLIKVDNVVCSLADKAIHEHNLYRGRSRKLSVIRKSTAYQLVYEYLKEQCYDFFRPMISEKLGGEECMARQCFFIRGVPLNLLLEKWSAFEFNEHKWRNKQ